MREENKRDSLKEGYSDVSINCNVEDISVPKNKDKNRQKIKKLKFEVKSCQDSIKRLFAFASGEKRIKSYPNSFMMPKQQRTETDDRMMFKTVAYLRAKIEQLEQEITNLRGK